MVPIIPYILETVNVMFDYDVSQYGRVWVRRWGDATTMSLGLCGVKKRGGPKPSGWLVRGPLTQAAQHGAAVAIEQAVMHGDVLQMGRTTEDEPSDSIRSIETWGCEHGVSPRCGGPRGPPVVQK